MNSTTSTADVEEDYPNDYLYEWMLPFGEQEKSFIKFLRLFMMVMTSTAVVVGIPGNVLVITSIVLVKPLKQLHHVFIANLALCDLGVMFMDLFVLLGAIYGSEFFIDRAVLCEFSGILCMMSCFGSLWSLMFIAVNRYLFILHDRVYRKVFNVKGTIIALGILWLCVFSLDLANMPFIGLGSHGFNSYGLHCSFVITEHFFYNTFVYSGLAVAFPAIVILFCYGRILYTTKKLAERFGATAGESMNKKRQMEQKQLTRSLVTIFIFFCVSWFPNGIIILLFGLGNSAVQKIPLHVAVLSEILAHWNSAINFIVLGFTHTGFRQAYIKILRAIFACKPMDNSHQSNATTAKSAIRSELK